MDEATYQRKKGALSAFCDITLRSQQVWSVDHLVELLHEWIEKSSSELAREDFNSPDFQGLCNRYLSARLATAPRNQISLMLQSVYSYKGNKKVADIRYGWDISKGHAQRMKKAELPPIEHAFTVSHADSYIPFSGHYSDLTELLEDQSTSYLERKFVAEWRSRHYRSNAPALIPEVHNFLLARESGLGRNFGYDDGKGNWRRGRIDFLVYNAGRGKAAFIELDGHKAHKSRERQQVDAMKRNECSKAQIPLLVFTYSDIEHHLDDVMETLDELFTPAT